MLSEELLTLRRFSIEKVKQLGKEEQVLKEKHLMKNMESSSFVPRVLCTCADGTYAALLLNTCLACPLASILHLPLDEVSAKFCASSVVIALEHLHKVGKMMQHFPFSSIIS